MSKKIIYSLIIFCILPACTDAVNVRFADGADSNGVGALSTVLPSAARARWMVMFPSVLRQINELAVGILLGIFVHSK